MNLNQAEEVVKKLVQEEIPSLIQQSANLQRNKILTGNYELKLARQQYFNDKQDQVRFSLFVSFLNYSMGNMRRIFLLFFL